MGPWYAHAYMINAEVQKSGTESALSVIRKFSRKVQGTGLIQTVRKGRYYERERSKTVSKKRTLKRIARQENYRELIKEGKIVETPQRGRGRGPQRDGPTQTSANQPQASTGSTGSTGSSSSTGRSSGLGESTPIAR